jgi:glycosyltransferase involved in cell wall biosynthesis
MFGARLHYAVPKLLYRSGLLRQFYTDVYAGNKTWIPSILAAIPGRLRFRIIDRFLGRADFELPANKVVSFDVLGLWYAWERWRTRHTKTSNRLHVKAAKSFAHRVLRSSFHDTNVLYGYNGASLELFKGAKERGILCILDQTIAPQRVVRVLLNEELDRWPNWESNLQLDDPQNVLQEREQVEWQLADVILGASQFVTHALSQEGVPKSKCRLLPYGVPLDRFCSGDLNQREPSARLRLLFAGEIGLRKGVPYLLEALRLLSSSRIEALFAGQIVVPLAELRAYRGIATFLGPVPRTKMMDLYRWADLLVLPSVCEGSALVSYEALACGVPIIVTPNSGAPVRDGIDGVVVPIRNSELLACAIERFIRDREFLQCCRYNALAGRNRLGLGAYQQRLIQVVHDIMEHSVCNAKR